MNSIRTQICKHSLTILKQVYPKLSQSYFLLLECLAMDHMAFLSTLDPAIFLYIIKSISEGLAAEGMTNLTSSDATGDSIGTLSSFCLLFHFFSFFFSSLVSLRSIFKTQNTKQTNIANCNCLLHI